MSKVSKIFKKNASVTLRNKGIGQIRQFRHPTINEKNWFGKKKLILTYLLLITYTLFHFLGGKVSILGNSPPIKEYRAK